MTVGSHICDLQSGYPEDRHSSVKADSAGYDFNIHCKVLGFLHAAYQTKWPSRKRSWMDLVRTSVRLAEPLAALEGKAFNTRVRPVSEMISDRNRFFSRDVAVK